MRALPPALISVIAALVAVLLLSAPAAAQSGKSLNGVALVIGQSEYSHIAALPNPAKDAREMVKLLTDLGFDARSVTDRDTARLKRDLERFAEDAEGADVALIYYSGHGIEADGENWLIPVDADMSALAAAETALIPLSGIIDGLKATVPVTIVLLDACRDSPFPAGTPLKRTPDAKPATLGEGGLAAVRGATPLARKAPAADTENLGMVIGFAAEPGRPALDGAAGGNSPYAAAILRHLAAMQGVEFGQVMRMVTEEVYLATGTQQRPWTNESLRRLLYFGLSPDEPDGVEATITGERRQLLLTMADLPDAGRLQVEKVAQRQGVKLDSLYGVLRALGQQDMPSDPAELERMLEAQAGKLRDMASQRAALRTDDPEIVRLSLAADRAIAEGAIVAARGFLDQAVARVEATAGTVDTLEAQLREKRIADAAIYARRADASALVFAFRAAADDYARAHELVSRWDGDLAWNYKNQQAEALRSLGDAHADRAVLEESLVAYQDVLDMLPNGEKGRDWAITRNNMALVLNTIGEHEEGDAALNDALAIFREGVDIFAALKDDVNWASAQNNVGNILLVLGGRRGDPAIIAQAAEAFRAALARRDRARVPLDWAGSQNNIGIAMFQLSEPEGNAAGLAEAEAAYRAALEVFTRETTPIDWAMTQNNLGNTLNALGLVHAEARCHAQAAEAFGAALSVRNREQWPMQWAASQLNLGVAYSHMGRYEMGTDAVERARAAFARALEVFDRAKTPLDWASAKNNLGSALQTLGQRGRDIDLLKRSADAFRDARDVYRRDDFPLDWAMTQNNLGNTLQVMAAVSDDPKYYRDAVAAYRQALREYRRDRAALQWALTTASMGNALQFLANSEENTRSLHEAVEARRAALDVLTPQNAPAEWANAQNGLGNSLLNLSNRERDPSVLGEAMAAFEASTQVFTRESQPLQWAFAQNYIGDAHWSLAALGGSKGDYGSALARFESAKDGFGQVGYQPLIELVDKKIALVRGEMQKR